MYGIVIIVMVRTLLFIYKQTAKVFMKEKSSYIQTLVEDLVLLGMEVCSSP